MNKLIERKRELFVLMFCLFVYLVGFLFLENIHFSSYIYTDSIFDQYIPFIDSFVIPYIFWFAYIVLGFVYFLIYDRDGFYRTVFYIFVGMYICLMIYLLFPSAQGLRVDLDLNHIFQRILSFIYMNDTATNVCPSIHVYNSIMMYISLRRNERFKLNRFMSISCLILSVLICMSTVFTKQHAVLDVFYALPLCVFVYYLEKSILYTKYLDFGFKERIFTLIKPRI